MKRFEKRDLFGIPPRETPPGIWPTTPTPPAQRTPAPVVETPAAPRRSPVPTGPVPSNVAVVRDVVLSDEE